MKVSDVLKKALKNLCREDVLSTSLLLENGEEPNSEQLELVDDLIECLNDTLESVAYVYHPMKTKQDVIVCDGKVSFSKLSKTLIDIISIKDKSDISVPFMMFPSYIECSNGEFQIIYTYLPDAVKNLDDEIEFPQGKVTARILATGVTSKFFLKRGMFQDANVWDVTFQRLLLVGQRPKHMPKLASRGWI